MDANELHMMVVVECLHLNMMVNNELHMMVVVYTSEAIMR